MADTAVTTILSVCATTGERVKELPVSNGQLIFVQDKHRIALDFNNKRRFYNQIEELSTDYARSSLLAPVSGMYYFVIETAVLWTYQEGAWVQITSRPEEIVFIGEELPELGQTKTLYVDSNDKEISIWDESAGNYVVVSDYTKEITADDIENLFK